MNDCIDAVPAIGVDDDDDAGAVVDDDMNATRKMQRFDRKCFSAGSR